MFIKAFEAVDWPFMIPTLKFMFEFLFIKNNKLHLSFAIR